MPQRQETKQPSSSWYLSETLQRRQQPIKGAQKRPMMQLPQLCWLGTPAMALHWRPTWQGKQHQVSQVWLRSLQQPRVELM